MSAEWLRIPLIKSKNSQDEPSLQFCNMCVRRMNTYDGLGNYKRGGIVVGAESPIRVPGYTNVGTCNALKANGAGGSPGDCYIED